LSWRLVWNLVWGNEGITTGPAHRQVAKNPQVPGRLQNQLQNQLQSQPRTIAGVRCCIPLSRWEMCGLIAADHHPLCVSNVFPGLHKCVVDRVGLREGGG
jgi:hypothetical protein